MERIKLKNIRRARRKKSIRRRVLGLPDQPRLTVFRSARHIYAQLIDDLAGRTLAAASTVEKGHKFDNGGNRDAAAEVGKALAARAAEAGISAAVFDRSGYRFHGRIKALADAAREGGLKF
jgi:large subunit ribosomal protein L18